MDSKRTLEDSVDPLDPYRHVPATCLHCRAVNIGMEREREQRPCIEPISVLAVAVILAALLVAVTLLAGCATPWAAEAERRARYARTDVCLAAAEALSNEIVCPDTREGRLGIGCTRARREAQTACYTAQNQGALEGGAPLPAPIEVHTMRAPAW
jgi:hypothetical protein